jgi:peptidoglycan/xylan/chitin deacetylase (PgdA/CDA1 family)
MSPDHVLGGSSRPDDPVIASQRMPRTGGAMTGTFALTFDTELIWGSFDELPAAAFARRYPEIRGVIDATLRLLDRYEVAATWAVIGHLFLDRCERDARGVAHPELAERPVQRWRRGDWYVMDPCTDRERDPLWYGPDVLDAIQAARMPHELGSHSFAHALYGDPEMTRAAVDADLDACMRVAAGRGIVLRSFVFPRNVEGHHEALAAHGFRAYRGLEPTWQAGARGPLGRAARLADHAIALAPPIAVPEERLPGLWNVPASMLLLSRAGPRRLATTRSRLAKVRSGLRRAAETGGVFHVWTHPFNLASDHGPMLGIVERMLREVAAARDRGEIVDETMGAIAERMSAAGSAREPAGVASAAAP